MEGKIQTIQENLIYVRQWFNELVVQIPSNIAHKDSFQFIIFSPLELDQGFLIRAILYVTFLGYKDEKTFEKIWDALMLGQGSMIRRDWRRDGRNDHIKISPNIASACWDRKVVLDQKLEAERFFLRARQKKIWEAYGGIGELAQTLKTKLADPIGDLETGRKKINRALRLMKAADARTFDGDFKAFKEKILDYLGLPADTRIS